MASLTRGTSHNVCGWFLHHVGVSSAVASSAASGDASMAHAGGDKGSGTMASVAA